MMRVYPIAINFCLMLFAILVYSRLTGYDLGLHELTPNKMIKEMLFLLYSLFSLVGLSILYLKKVNASVSGGVTESLNLVIAVLLACSFVVIVGLFIPPPFHIGDIVKLYMASFIFYILPIFIWLFVLLNKSNTYLSLNAKKVIALGIVSFTLGLVLYFVKDHFVLVGNINTIMQLILVVTCLVFPFFYLLVGIIAIFLKWRSQN